MRDTEKIGWWAILAVYGMFYGLIFTLSTFFQLNNPFVFAVGFSLTVVGYLFALMLRLTYLKGRKSNER